jgi:outer membrane protein OmpA-like peptidoglycan-associated protein
VAAPAAAPAAPAATTASAPAPLPAATATADVVKIHFEVGKAEIPAGGMALLDKIVVKAKAGGRIVISGFHDATGNLEQNQELAKKRAFAVRDAIKSAAGIGDERFEMKKPEVTQGSGDNIDARRVEVRVM